MPGHLIQMQKDPMDGVRREMRPHYYLISSGNPTQLRSRDFRTNWVGWKHPHTIYCHRRPINLTPVGYSSCKSNSKYTQTIMFAKFYPLSNWALWRLCWELQLGKASLIGWADGLNPMIGNVCLQVGFTWPQVWNQISRTLFWLMIEFRFVCIFLCVLCVCDVFIFRGLTIGVSCNGSHVERVAILNLRVQS